MIYIERNLPGQVAWREAALLGYIRRLEQELLAKNVPSLMLDNYADDAIASAVRMRTESLMSARKEEREIIEARDMERQREAAREDYRNR